MITILHGQDALSSRNTLLQLRDQAKEKEIQSINGEKLTLPELTTILESRSLFSSSRLVIIENLLSSRPSKSRDELILYIARGMYDSDLVLWDDKDVTAAVLKKLPKAKVQSFKPSLSVFRFVDSIGIATSVVLLEQFHTLLKEEPAEILFVMIVRQFRNLLLLKDPQQGKPSPLPPWQASKLSSQLRVFSQEKLVANYRKLLDIDYKIKSGLTPLSLPQLLDIFLLSL